MASQLIEIQACLSSLEDMLDRAKKFDAEYDREIRPYFTSGSISSAPEVSSLKYAIAFSELRSLDLMCKDAIERCLPGHPELMKKWFVYDDLGVSGPKDVITDLLNKRIILKQAIALLGSYDDAPAAGSIQQRPLPAGYSKLNESVSLFFKDTKNNCQDYDKNVFIMTRFMEGNKELNNIYTSVKETLQKLGLNVHRADDRCYLNDRNLWDNVCTYMVCCKFGVAILEDILVKEFNPNVAMEYGFMRALGKPTLLLKEKRLNPRADILGTIWEEFDILDIETTIPPAIERWSKDIL